MHNFLSVFLSLSSLSVYGRLLLPVSHHSLRFLLTLSHTQVAKHSLQRHTQKDNLQTFHRLCSS